MLSASATHTGRVRKNNEDCVLADDTLGIYLLADGIGGLDAGEVASALAVEKVYEILRTNIDRTATDSLFELMVHAIHSAHWEINTLEQGNAHLKRMGTTLVIAVIRDGQAHIVHAGDSRCYLFQRPTPATSPESSSDGETSLTCLTHDHTLGNLQLTRGIEASSIPRKHFQTLTQSVGCGDPPLPDFTVVDLLANDLLLICSDGLTDMLSDGEIEAYLGRGGTDLEQLATQLIDAANQHGGRDNISVILVTTA